MSYVTGLRCRRCQQTLAPQPFRYLCPCGGFLEVQYDYERMAAELSPALFNGRQGPILQQWLEFLPVERPELVDRVTLGERPTPMLPARRLPAPADRLEVWLKNDASLPTGSLKDRSMPISVLKALECGRAVVGTVSSGNAAASLAAYAAAAGLRAVVFMGGDPSPSKLYKTMIYKPIGVHVTGTFAAADALFSQARDEFGFFDCQTLVNPYRLEGKKTFAYEIARDLGWRAPRTVLMPTASGGGIMATWKGFQELRRLGFIAGLPAIVGVQPAQFAPIARAFAAGRDTVEPVPGGPSLAQALCVTDPGVAGELTLQAVRQSGGAMVAVGEDEIAEAVRLLGEREGYAIEPAGAIGLAALLKLARVGSPLAQGTQVVVLTGHGLNDPGSGSAVIEPPLRVAPEYEAVQTALRQALI